MAAEMKFTTRELSKRTWPDFERLFESHPAPGAHPCWCMYNHFSGPAAATNEPRAVRIERHRQMKRALVERGSSHGILVYEGDWPVGWCQYGLRRELPRIDRNPAYRKLPPAPGDAPLWRITCFVVSNRFRRCGVATAALNAALAAIRKRGGGVVEAYPIAAWGAYAAFRGAVSMFRKQGFRVVGAVGANNVLVRRQIS